jgi:3-deoxy-D-manno-octulosonic-acid transferase
LIGGRTVPDIMFILYDLIFVIFAIIYLPCFLIKKKLHRGIIQRLGFVSINSSFNGSIWIHAVSVGEAKIAGTLVKQIRKSCPGQKIAISTVTPTGNRIVNSFRTENDFVFYLPFDLSFITKRVIRKLKPGICIIVETEIWPNLITQLNKMNVPIVLVNARISDRSFLGYRMIKPLIKFILSKINLFCVQSNRDAQRLSVLGVPADKLEITGNMKYDILDLADFKIDYAGLRLRLGLSQEQRLLVAGSTHPGEEEIILDVYGRLINEFPGLRLLIAPRHPERASQIEGLVNRSGFSSVLISKLDRQTDRPTDRQTIFVLDTIGHLIPFYAAADIVFVGGSLIRKGGQNILEPAFFSKTIIFGPHMFNFRDISDLFLSKGAARMVHGQEELLKEIRFLLSNASEFEIMGRRARQLVLENQGTTRRNVEFIRTAFPKMLG